MQFLMTHGSLARTRVPTQRRQLGAALFGLVVVLTLLSGTVYNFFCLKTAREGRPFVPIAGRAGASVEPPSQGGRALDIEADERSDVFTS